jgi:pyruvate dehydrogenase E1 component alpha subunit
VLAVAGLELALLIRHFEQKVLDLFAQGQINGTTHTCLGQEYIPVALRPLLSLDDCTPSASSRCRPPCGRRN